MISQAAKGQVCWWVDARLFRLAILEPIHPNIGVFSWETTNGIPPVMENSIYRFYRCESTCLSLFIFDFASSSPSLVSDKLGWCRVWAPAAEYIKSDITRYHGYNFYTKVGYPRFDLKGAICRLLKLRVGCEWTQDLHPVTGAEQGRAEWLPRRSLGDWCGSWPLSSPSTERQADQGGFVPQNWCGFLINNGCELVFSMVTMVSLFIMVVNLDSE